MTASVETTDVRGWLSLRQGAFTLDAEFRFPLQGVTALFGPSGSGKSTLLRALAGLEESARGRLQVADTCWQSDRHRLPPHQRPIGYVFQETNLFQHLDVQANLLFGYRRVPPEQRRLQPAEVVEKLGLNALLERRVSGLSGGERQRVAIARALLTSPRLLLLDEPLAALDRTSKHEILPYLESLRDIWPMPILYVSHSHEEVARLADYLLLMREGRITAQGPVAELVNRLDSPLAVGDESFSLLHCRVDAQLRDFQLTRLAVGGHSLLVPTIAGAPGRELRLRVQARDVSLCLSKPDDSSILNILPVQLREVSEARAGQRLLLLEGNGLMLTARISELSLRQLGLQVGQNVYAQVKSAALLE